MQTPTWADQIALTIWVLLPFALWAIAIYAMRSGAKRRRERRRGK